MIAGFILSILTILVVLVGFTMPRYYDAFIPIERRGEGTEPTVAMEIKGELAGKPMQEIVHAEHGLFRETSSEHESKAVKDDDPVK